MGLDSVCRFLAVSAFSAHVQAPLCLLLFSFLLSLSGRSPVCSPTPHSLPDVRQNRPVMLLWCNSAALYFVRFCDVTALSARCVNLFTLAPLCIALYARSISWSVGWTKRDFIVRPPTNVARWHSCPWRLCWVIIPVLCSRCDVSLGEPGQNRESNDKAKHWPEWHGLELSTWLCCEAATPFSAQTWARSLLRADNRDLCCISDLSRNMEKVA